MIHVQPVPALQHGSHFQKLIFIVLVTRGKKVDEEKVREAIKEFQIIINNIEKNIQLIKARHI